MEFPLRNKINSLRHILHLFPTLGGINWGCAQCFVCAHTCYSSPGITCCSLKLLDTVYNQIPYIDDLYMVRKWLSWLTQGNTYRCSHVNQTPSFP